MTALTALLILGLALAVATAAISLAGLAVQTSRLARERILHDESRDAVRELVALVRVDKSRRTLPMGPADYVWPLVMASRSLGEDVTSPPVFETAEFDLKVPAGFG